MTYYRKYFTISRKDDGACDDATLSLFGAISCLAWKLNRMFSCVSML